MPEGVIVGGWGYIIAAYALVAVVLVLYATSLIRRLRKADDLATDSRLESSPPTAAGRVP